MNFDRINDWKYQIPQNNRAVVTGDVNAMSDKLLCIQSTLAGLSTIRTTSERDWELCFVPLPAAVIREIPSLVDPLACLFILWYWRYTHWQPMVHVCSRFGVILGLKCHLIPVSRVIDAWKCQSSFLVWLGIPLWIDLVNLQFSVLPVIQDALTSSKIGYIVIC